MRLIILMIQLVVQKLILAIFYLKKIFVKTFQLMRGIS